MDESNNPSTSASAAAHEEVLRVLKLRKSRSRQAELIVAALTGYLDIVGQEQDAGQDRPFDLRAPDDSVRLDVKTQKGGVLDVKKEKVAKQFEAWSAGHSFLPIQVVLDSKTQGWYVVAGIPTATRTALDPLDTQFDPNDPGKPFCVGKCLLEELQMRGRFETMRTRLNKGLQDVKDNGEAVRKKVSRERQSYLDTLAKFVLVEGDLQAAILRSIGGSEVTLDNLARIEQAMTNLAKSDEAMKKLGQSDEAMKKLAQSDEAIARLAQSDETMLKLLGPELFARWKAQQNPPAE